MTCPDCTKAATNAIWPGYHANCHGCKVRALANGPQFWRSMQSRVLTPKYQEQLAEAFGAAGAEAAHAEVKAEYARLKALRGGTP